MQTAAIACHGVKKSYSHFELGPLDLDVPKGSVMGFVGPNGAGKSTTMRICMGLVRPDAGEVTVLGHDMPAQQVQAKSGIGFVSEDMRLYGGKSLGFHMNFMSQIYDDWDQQYAEALLDRFDLKADQAPKGYSHGQRVKAMLVLAMARKPKLLILDEPTTGLDPVARHETLHQMMDALADEERTILFSSHNTLDVEQISDNITFILDGQLLVSEDKESFLERWRRLRFEGDLPADLETCSEVSSGRQTIVTTDQFSESSLAKWQESGQAPSVIERLTLEEIFLACVARSKETSQ
ncbi:MAG: ABC transporter ATP-binding protein [Pseudomonadota bacterium]